MSLYHLVGGAVGQVEQDDVGEYRVNLSHVRPDVDPSDYHWSTWNDKRLWARGQYPEVRVYLPGLPTATLAWSAFWLFDDDFATGALPLSTHLDAQGRFVSANGGYWADRWPGFRQGGADRYTFATLSVLVDDAVTGLPVAAPPIGVRVDVHRPQPQ